VLRANVIARQMELLKIAFGGNALRRNLDRDCVLFVQHPQEKARIGAVDRSYFVACAETFGNCDLATEGGHPEVVPF